jgi:chromosomal replication initiation ATPase DnaA
LYIVDGLHRAGPREFSPIRKRALRIAKLVAAEYELTLDDLTGKRKYQELIEPRQVLYWLCRHVGGWSFKSIGRALEKDYSAVIKGGSKIEAKRQTKDRLQKRLDSLVAATEGFEVGS